MDEMTEFRGIHDIPWSLIYRKLKGKRGCTPLLPHEAEGLKRMLDLRNAGQALSGPYFELDEEIICLTESQSHIDYEGQTDADGRIDNRLKCLINETNRAWEHQLEAYLLQEIERDRS